jgi:hypothetical protein
MINSSDIFLHIESGIEYYPENDETVIFQIHCTKTNTCPIKIWTYSSNDCIEFPPQSFIQGAIYPIVVYKMEFQENEAAFIGYKRSRNANNNFMRKGLMSQINLKNK